jgi:hypothetical protein
MKIHVNDEQLFELSDIQKKIIMTDIHADEFEQDMKRRLKHALHDKLAACYRRLRQEWEPKLIAEGVESLPTNEEKFAALVMEHKDYRCRKMRDEEERLAKHPENR